MEEVLNGLRENVNKLDNTNSTSAAVIYDELEDFDGDRRLNFASFIVYVESIQDIQYEGVEDGELQRKSVQDGLSAIEKRIDRVAGQVGVSNRPLSDGSGPLEAAQYIDNAVESCEEAREKIIHLTYAVVSGELSFDETDDEPLVDDVASIENLSGQAKTEIRELQEALETASQRLKS